MGATDSDSGVQDPDPVGGTTPFALGEDGNSIDIRGWKIRLANSAIAASSVEATLTEALGIKLPGMLFDKSFLQLTFTSPAKSGTVTATGRAFDLSFRAVEALKMVGEADPSVRVKAAKNWDSKSDRSDVDIITIEKASDWTFSTTYPGTITIESNRYDDLRVGWCPGEGDKDDGVECAAAAKKCIGVDYDALRNMDIPILFSGQVILFEDELDDNGTASYMARIRVMPEFFFILARFFLRVDGVLIRIYDTRYFHRFGTEVLVRESVKREADLTKSLTEVHPSVLRDPDLVAQKLPVISMKVENIAVPS